MQVVLCVLLVVLHGDDEPLVLNTQACRWGSGVCNAFGYLCRVVHLLFRHVAVRVQQHSTLLMASEGPVSPFF